jgi:hypothetical protein
VCAPSPQARRLSAVLQVQADPQQIARMAHRARPYDYLPAVLAEIERDGAPEYLPFAIRGYAELGFYGPARELLDRLDPAARQSPELAAVRAKLAHHRTGQLSWTTCAGRFRRNLEILLRRDGGFAVIAQAWADAADQYELYRAADGNYQVCRRDSGGRRWLPALADHQAWARQQQLQHDEKALMPEPYLFEGLGRGHYFRRVYRATLDTFLGYSCALYVVERDPLPLAICLHLHDWREVLADPRVMIFVGDDCLERFAAALEADDDLPLPRLCMQLPRWSPGSDPSPVEVVNQVGRRRRRREEEVFARIQARYADRDASYWARRFAEALAGQGPPLRILSAVSVHTSYLQYSMRDAHQAFEQLGCHTRLLTEQSDHHCISPLTYGRAIEEFDPDLFFVIDHLRGGHERILPANLPMFTWDQDLLPHAINAQTVRTMGPLDVLGGICKRHCVITLGCDERRVVSAIMPTNPNEYSADPVPETERAPYRCDVSYVSHASQTPRQFHEQEVGQLEDRELRRFMAELYEVAVERSRRQPICGGRSLDVLAEAERRSGLRINDPNVRKHLVGWYLWRLADRLYRHQALEWVGRWARETDRRFHLYGRGWENHPTLKPFARGVAGNGQELRCIYQASSINLQLMPAGFLHQRALDGLAAGGFFLARRGGSDYESVAIGRILDRLAELGLTSLADPRALHDDELQAAIGEYERQTGRQCDPSDPGYLVSLRILAEHPSPGALFPRFGELLFDDPDSFGRAADRFVDNAPLRREIAEQMRQVVLDRFTYVETMQRFLHFMRDYLGQVAAEAGPAESQRSSRSHRRSAPGGPPCASC